MVSAADAGGGEAAGGMKVDEVPIVEPTFGLVDNRYQCYVTIGSNRENPRKLLTTACGHCVRHGELIIMIIIIITIIIIKLILIIIIAVINLISVIMQASKNQCDITSYLVYGTNLHRAIQWSAVRSASNCVYSLFFFAKRDTLRANAKCVYLPL